MADEPRDPPADQSWLEMEDIFTGKDMKRQPDPIIKGGDTA